jgi:hypothetical protein
MSRWVSSALLKGEEIMEMGVAGFFLKGMGLLEDQFANITN